jgi:anti-anti-sigma regulatory factor
MGAALVPLAVHPLQLTPPGADGGPLFGVHGTPGSGIGLVGEIDCWCADQLSVLLAAASGDLHEPVLDISGLRFADVAAIRAIAGAAHELARTYGRVRLHGALPTFRKVWRLMRLDTRRGRIWVQSGWS